MVTNVTARNCHLLNHNSTGGLGGAYINSISGAVAPFCAGLFVENCFFAGNTRSLETASSGVAVSNSQNTQIRSSVFSDFDTAVDFTGDGLLFEDCQVNWKTSPTLLLFSRLAVVQLQV